jgi:hypothetical protein
MSGLPPGRGQYGRYDDGVQLDGAFNANPTMLDLVWDAARTFEPVVCPNCGSTRFRYLWSEHRVRCQDCGTEGSGREVRAKDRVEVKGGFTHYDLEKYTGLEYGVSLGPRRRDLADKPIKKHGSGRSPLAGARWIVNTGFVRAVSPRNSRQTVWMAFWYLQLERVGASTDRRQPCPEVRILVRR